MKRINRAAALLLLLLLPAGVSAQPAVATDGGKHSVLAVDRKNIDVYAGDKCAFLGVTADAEYTCTTTDADAPVQMFRVTKMNDGLLRLDFNETAPDADEAVDLILRTADGGVLKVPVRRFAGISNADRDFMNYMKRKAPLITVNWSAPFPYETIRTNHAPKGPYLGNGDVGVVAHTGYNSQTLRISKVDFVTDGWSDWAGSGAAALPVGGISLTVGGQTAAASFAYTMNQPNARLHMTTGTENPVSMTSWISREGNWIVTELTTASAVPVKVSVETFADSARAVYASAASLHGDVMQAVRTTRTDGVEWVSRAAVTSRVIGAEVSALWQTAHKAAGEFEVSSARPVYVVTLVSGGGKTGDPKTEWALEEIGKADAARVERMRDNHAAWWRDMWARSYVETGDPMLDRQYLTSIYLLASALDKDAPSCPGMYGVWNMDDEMMYHGDIHLNYNTQGGFYSVYSANRPELAMPFYRFIELMIPEGRRRAQEDLHNLHGSLAGKKCRGILFPVSALGVGAFYGPYWKQTMDAPFNVPLFNWYYEYTGDTGFLSEHNYPFLKEIGDFYEDYLVKEPYGDSYRYCITTGAHENSWDLNPASDLCFVELTFRLLLKYSEQLGVDADRRDLWRDILAHLPGYKVVMPTQTPNQGLPVYAKNEDGWDSPNHAIQMHPVYPAEVLNIDSHPDSVQIARNTLYYYQVDQNGFTGRMNELGLGTFIMAARLGMDPELLIEKMKELIGRAEHNLLIHDGHHCLEKTAIVESVNSMLLQSTNETLRFFPCWPKRPASFTRLRAKGAFLVSAIYNGEEVVSLELVSEKGNPCRFANPWPGHEVEVLAADGVQPVTVDGDLCTFPTTAGGSYTICKR